MKNILALFASTIIIISKKCVHYVKKEKKKIKNKYKDLFKVIFKKIH